MAEQKPSLDQAEGLRLYVFVMFAVMLSVTAMYFARDLVILMVVSGLFAFLLLPFERGLERWIPRWVSALIATLVMLLVVVALLFFLGWQFSRFAEDLPEFKEKLAEKGDEVQRWISGHMDVSRREQEEWVGDHATSAADLGEKAAIKAFEVTGSMFADVVPIPIFVFLLLLFKDRFRNFFTMLGSTREGSVLDVMVSISTLSRKYMRGVVTVTFIFGTLCSIGFTILGLKYALLLGFVLALLNLVPYVGALIGSLLPIFIAILTKDSMLSALGALGVCLVVQFLDNNIITPKVVGSSVSINPLASLIAIIGFGMLWGVAGMLLAIPITGMLKVMCDSIPSLRPWGYLLGEEIETPDEKRYHFGWRQRPAPTPARVGKKGN